MKISMMLKIRIDYVTNLNLYRIWDFLMTSLMLIFGNSSVIAKSDVSLIQVNVSTLDRAAEETQLRFLKVFVKYIN